MISVERPRYFIPHRIPLFRCQILMCKYVAILLGSGYFHGLRRANPRVLLQLYIILMKVQLGK